MILEAKLIVFSSKFKYISPFKFAGKKKKSNNMIRENSSRDVEFLWSTGSVRHQLILDCVSTNNDSNDDELHQLGKRSSHQ